MVAAKQVSRLRILKLLFRGPREHKMNVLERGIGLQVGKYSSHLVCTNHTNGEQIQYSTAPNAGQQWSQCFPFLLPVSLGGSRSLLHPAYLSPPTGLQARGNSSSHLYCPQSFWGEPVTERRQDLTAPLGGGGSSPSFLP